MSQTALPARADAVVIGAGALGAATAFHLVKAGMSVVLLDKAEPGSQSSRRAAGLSGQLRSDETMTRIAARSVRKIETFEADTGEKLAFFQPGSLKVARRPEHAAQLEDEVARGHLLGVDAVMLRPEEARRLMPYLATDGVLAVMHVRSDVYLEPIQIPVGYARASARLGAAVLPNTPVEEVLTEGGRVSAVGTARGEIRTGVVVDAAGAWVRAIAARGGASVKALPTRHQLMVTMPLPGVRPDQPITRIIDANVYVRPEKGGLMLGGYETDPVQYGPGELAADFDMEDLELDLSVLRRLAASVEAQFPVFRDAALQEHRGGLPTMTADGEHILGPVPGIAGFYVIGGCCVGGLSTAPALGELLAEWITRGTPSIEVPFMAPARQATNLPESELRELCRLQYAHHYWAPKAMPDLIAQ